MSDPAFSDALRRADRRRGEVGGTRRQERRRPERGGSRGEESGPGPLLAPDAQPPLPIPAGGRELVARASVAPEPEPLAGLVGLEGQGAARVSDCAATARPSAVLLAPSETAAVLAFYLKDAWRSLDRHRRFELEVTHPVHGLLRLSGSLRGAQLRVAFQVAPRARRHLQEAGSHLGAALREEGLELVSFLPGTP